MNKQPSRNMHWRYLTIYIGLLFIISGVPCSHELFASGTNELKKVKVVEAFDPHIVQHLIPDSIRAKVLFEKAFLQYTGAANTKEGWKQFVSPSDRVGIKIYTFSGPNLATHREIVSSIVQGLKSAGVSGSNIIIFDQYATIMDSAGYKTGLFDDGTTRIMANVPGAGFDADVQVDSPIPGKLVWGDLEFKKSVPEKEDQLSNKSHFSKIITQDIDKLINVAIPTTHPQLGFWGCELNLSLSLCDNFRRFQRPSYSRDDSLTEIYTNPAVQKKIILNILDALVLQYAGGLECDPNFCWPHQTIYLSMDAVALDSIAVQEIDKIRPKASLQPLGEISYLKNAVDAGAGSSNLSDMDIQKITISN